MVMVVIVPFLNEEEHLLGLLESISGQSRLPDRLVLVDDGSTDASPAIARDFADRHPYARALQRPPRPPARDRLATASEWGAWQWALEQTDMAGDLLVKLDADLRLPPRMFEVMESQFRVDPELGVAGAHLSTVDEDGVPRREHNADDHVRGATKFYRAECYRDISPVPQVLGWDTIDELTARMRGWRTGNVAVPGGDPVQMRMTGTYDGRLRGFRRRGVAAYGYGAHPLHVLLGALRRATDRPYVVAGASYVLGWVHGCIRRSPRAAPEVRAFARREQIRRLRRRIAVFSGR
ncbi:MAG: glycosyltransferase family 2 protein [Actinobacteria bacterium]|nr:glycosyltransferase family 2 protein [Actinomycetota bacterium]